MDTLREFLKDPLYALAFAYIQLHMKCVMADAAIERKLRERRCRKCTKTACKHRI